MKKCNAWIAVSYLVAIGYLFLGYFFYDWSFHMVPYVGKKLEPKMVLDLFSASFLALTGVSMLLSIIFIARRKSFAPRFHLAMFQLIFLILIVGSLAISYFVAQNNFLEGFAGVVGFLSALGIPAIAIFFITRNVVLPNQKQ